MADSRAGFRKRVKEFAAKHAIPYTKAYGMLKKLEKKQRMRHARTQDRPDRQGTSVPDPQEG